MSVISCEGLAGTPARKAGRGTTCSRATPGWGRTEGRPATGCGVSAGYTLTAGSTSVAAELLVEDQDRGGLDGGTDTDDLLALRGFRAEASTQ